MLRALIASTIILPLAALAGCNTYNSTAVLNPDDMASLHEKAVRIGEANALNHLASIAADASRTYSGAAGRTGNAAVHEQLASIAVGHKEFASRLETRVAALDVKPTVVEDDFIYGTYPALNGFIENDPRSAAGELHRGETYLLGELTEALDTQLSPDSRRLIEDKLVDVTADRDQVQQLQARLGDDVSVKLEQQQQNQPTNATRPAPG